MFFSWQAFFFFLGKHFFFLDKHFFFFLYTAVVVVVVVLALTRIIKSVVTGQAPVTLELRNTPGKNTVVRVSGGCPFVAPHHLDVITGVGW